MNCLTIVFNTSLVKGNPYGSFLVTRYIYIYITPRNKYKKNPCNKLGTFTWVVMPFGLKNGPPIYQ